MPSTVKMQRWHNSCKKKMSWKQQKVPTTRVVFLSFTDGHLRSLFWLGEELYTEHKDIRYVSNRGRCTSGGFQPSTVPIADQWNVGDLLFNIFLVYTVCFHLNRHTVFTSLFTFWYTVIFHFRVPTTGEEIIVSLPT